MSPPSKRVTGTEKATVASMRWADAPSFSPFLVLLFLTGSVMVAALSAWFGFRTNAPSPGTLLLMLCLCAMLRLPQALRAVPLLILPFDTLLAAYVVTDLSLVLPWQVQAFNLPLVDDAVRAFDRSLGFEHATWMGWLNQHSDVLKVLSTAYRSLIIQPLVLIALCLLTGRIRHLDAYIGACWINVLLASVISMLLPTRGIIAFLDPALFATPAWPFGATDLSTYDGLRSGAVRELLDLPRTGIISFPSCHAASAVLATWGFWRWRVTRYPAIVLNALLTVATVGCGGHYIADVIAGYACGGISVLLAVRGSAFGYALMERMSVLLDRPGTVFGRTARA